jgi:two-component system, LuxR family, sensor kinase FixL
MSMETKGTQLQAEKGMPLKISLIYALTGSLWILFSDLALSLVSKDPAVITRLEIYKGWAFIGITALMLFLLIRRNIGAIRRSEQSLHATEERFRLLVEGVTDYEIFMLDPEGRILIWNIGAERSKGYRPEEVIGKPHTIFFTPADIERGLPEWELKEAAEQGRSEDEGWRVRKDGTQFWANVVCSALRDGQGNLLGFSKVIRDITEKKRNEERLRESEESYRVIAETASDAILTIDEESRIVFANASVGRIFGYSPAELLGQDLTVLMPERMRGRHREGLKRYRGTGEKSIRSEVLELPGLHRDGREIPLEISYGEFTKNGSHFFTGIVRDITERKQAEKEKEYSDMLEKFNTELENLVAERTMSLIALRLADKVRNPSMVIGWTGKRILAMEEVPAKIRKGLLSIIGEAEKLEATVQDFQSLLKRSTSAFSYENINEIVNSVIPVVEQEAARKGVKVFVDLSDQIMKLNAQKDLLRMAIFNMLRNAVEATSEGGAVTVRTSVDNDSIILTVSDSGHAIPKDVLEKIFDPLYDAQIYRFGMGLPLIKQIVSEHLGEIFVESDSGRGTTFKVVLPARWTEKSDAGTTSS